MVAPSRPALLAAALLLPLAACGDDAPGADAGGGGDGGGDAALALEIASGRADMVTGGDALVRLLAPEAEIAAVSVTLDGAEVASRFREHGEPGSRLARLDGLSPGPHQLVATLGGRSATLELVDHPITGPVFSGPHEQPYACTTEDNLLGPPTDEDCSADTIVAYLYRSSDGSFKPLADPTAPPADIVQTTTSAGVTTDFIVRLELGTINRAIYWVATLHDPAAAEWEPWSPPSVWNRKAVYMFFGGCGTGYSQGDPSLALAANEGLLGQGYALLHSSLNTLGNNCNDVLSAESAMMVKEHFVEHYGVPLYTVGLGASGGAIQQHLIADNYPGILDGVIAQISYPDIWSIYPGILDCVLLSRYFDENAGLWPDDEARRAVTGHATLATCENWIALLGQLVDPAAGCLPGVPPDAIYDPESNPDGARCTLQDHTVNVFGVDPATGFARRPFDNRGVQYGLEALGAGQISPEQFLDLNAEIGGFDIDGNRVPGRSQADPQAVRIAYASGRILDGGNGLAGVPIVDLRLYNDPAGDIHDAFRTLSTRQRLVRANGDADNHVAFIHTADPGASLGALVAAFSAMDGWLEALAADADPDRHAAVLRARPDGLADRCYINAEATPGLCPDLLPPHSSPRRVAGAPIENDILQCALAPIDPADYPSLSAQQLEQLQQIFAGGVCDWSAAPPNRVDHAGPWQQFDSVPSP